MTETVHIGSSALGADIALLGAELQRLTDGEERDLLWDGDPAYWSGRAPILFPIVGTLRDDHFRHDGKDYSLPRHGFARRHSFTVVDHRADQVVMRLESDDATRKLWPFAFTLNMRFAIEGSRIGLSAEVINHSDQPMPTSFGFHPALRWPLPGGGPKTDHVILFDRDEPAPVRRLDSHGLIDPEPRRTPIDGKRLALSDDLFVEDALILDRIASRRLTYGASTGPRLSVDFAGLPELGLWSKPGAGFLCIEPWHGFADPAGFEGDITTKPGVKMIAPGEGHVFGMGIAIDGK
jgi:galactose mutarotase-like enzyme